VKEPAPTGYPPDPMEVDVTRLMIAVKAGDRDAFDTLVSKLRSRAFHVAHSLVGSREDALDMTQEAFIRLWKHLPPLRRGKERSWLFKTGRNLCLDRLRRRKIVAPPASSPQASSPFPEPVDPHPAPDEQITRSETHAHILATIEQMPESLRSVFVLKEIEGCSCREIARICNTPIGTVKVYLMRARQHLQQRLHDFHPQPS